MVNSSMSFEELTSESTMISPEFLNVFRERFVNHESRRESDQ
jgi:hypothetical protein